jgi:hypothetical protein
MIVEELLVQNYLYMLYHPDILLTKKRFQNLLYMDPTFRISRLHISLCTLGTKQVSPWSLCCQALKIVTICNKTCYHIFLY